MRYARKQKRSVAYKANTPTHTHTNIPGKHSVGNQQKTATQLRNARKRRAKQKLQQQQNNDHSTKSSSKSNNNTNNNNDPSLRYIRNPLKAPMVRKAKQYFPQRFQLEYDPVVCGTAQKWRTVAKLAVGYTSNSSTVNSTESGEQPQPLLTIGLFAPQSHRIVAVPDCPAHHTSINTAVQAIQRVARTIPGLQPFATNNNKNDTTSTTEGQFRYVCFQVERSTGQVQVTLVWNRAADPGHALLNALVDKILKDSAKMDQSKKWLHSLWVHDNSTNRHSNAIIHYEMNNNNAKFDIDNDPLWEHRYGPKHVIERLGLEQNVPLVFPPQVFRQANLDAFANIVRKIQSHVQTHVENHLIVNDSSETNATTCVELYGGVGTIGLHLTPFVDSLISSDANPYNKACFDQAAAAAATAVTKPSKSKAQLPQYYSLDATAMVEQHLDLLRGADIIVVDPPRKGLEPVVCEALRDLASSTHSNNSSSKTSLLVYVSCGFDALQRDLAILTGGAESHDIDGAWKVDHAEGHVLFPGSDAIESLVFLTRGDSGS